MNGQPDLTPQDHAHLVEYYRVVCDGDWLGLADITDARQNLCANLFAAGEFETLYALVAETDSWAKARYQREGDYAAYLTDLGLAWRWVESDAAWDVARQVRCLLIHSAIQGFSAPATRDPESTIQWFLQISARHMPPEACLDAIAIARGLADIDLKAHLLGDFAARLPDPFRREALAELLDTGDSRLRGRALVMQLRELTSGLRDTGIQTVLAALGVEDDSGKAFTLSYLGSVLPDDLKPTAMDVAQHIEDPQARADAFADLAMPWSGQWRQRAMDAALKALLTNPDESNRVVTLARFIERWGSNVPPGLRLDEFFYRTRDSYFRLAALSIILPFLSAERVIPLTIAALEVAATISAAEQRAASLLPLLDYPLGGLRSRVLETAWQAIGAIAEVEKKLWRFRALIRRLKPSLEDALRGRAVGEARDTIASINSPWSKVVELEWLARDVPEIQEQLYQEALQTAMSVEDAVGRARTLSKVAIGFSEPPPQTALRLSLATLHEVHDPWAKSIILRELSARAPSDLIPDVLDLTETIADPDRQAEVLRYLAAHRPVEVGRQVMELARGTRDNRVIASLLATLARNVADESKAALLREALALSAQLPLGNKHEPARSTILHWIVNTWQNAAFAGVLPSDITVLLHALGQASLPDMINDFADYLPLAEHLAGAGMLAPTVKTLRDVLAWWPQPGVMGETETEPQDSPQRNHIPF